MKYLKKNANILIFLLSLLPAVSYASELLTLDFGWSTPKFENAQNVSWSYKVANSNQVPLCSPFEIIMVTDEGKQYMDSKATRKAAQTNSLNSLYSVSGDIYPDVTKSGTALFENVSPEIKSIYFYINGLVVEKNGSCGKKSNIFKIFYKRNKDQWNLEITKWIR